MIDNVFLDRIANHLIMNSSFEKDLGLYHGKMGIVIFFAHYAKYTKKEIYNDFASRFLEEIYTDIHNDTPINMQNGLCGIGWSIEYLLQKNLLEGDSNEILSDIDKKIMERDPLRMNDASFEFGLNGILYAARSQMSSIIENIKLSDLGLTYFMTTILFLFSGYTFLLSYISLLCIFMILFSLIYQSFVLKVYCPLCLCVVGMLVCDILIYWYDGFFDSMESVTIESGLYFSGLAVLLSGFWFSTKTVIKNNIHNENFKYLYARLLNNPERIRTLLDSVCDSELKKTDYNILLGYNNPRLIISEIISPFCAPCGRSIQKVSELLKIFDEGLQICIILTNNKGDKKRNQEIISHLLALSKESNQEMMLNALLDWFEIMDYQIWSKKYPLKCASLTEKEIANYFESIKTYRIQYTPTFFRGLLKTTFFLASFFSASFF